MAVGGSGDFVAARVLSEVVFMRGSVFTLDNECRGFLSRDLAEVSRRRFRASCVKACADSFESGSR